MLFLALYLPWSALELHRRNQTLPFRMFGLRFCTVDGTRVHGLRIAALWSFPRLLIGLLPFLAALYLDLDSRLGPGLSVSGPLLLLLDALTAWGMDRRTMLDRFARLKVVKS
ncbi:MAG: hypothetical protein IPL96_03000 [Holophagaceae bacterium]|nr:hypothetical protein [Holophagaceae bacterium]